MQVLLEQYGRNTRWGPGVLSFYPATSWGDAMKVAEECVEGGMRVDLPLRKGRCGSRHLCVRLLRMCGTVRRVPEVMCEKCGDTARRFKADAKADGWSGLYHSRPWPHQKRFPENGWGYAEGARRAGRKGATTGGVGKRRLAVVQQPCTT